MDSESDNVMLCKTNVVELIDKAYFRYRRQKANGNTKKQGGQKSSEFRNDAFTNDYTNTSKIISDKKTNSMLLCFFWSCIIIDKRTSLSSV